MLMHLLNHIQQAGQSQTSLYTVSSYEANCFSLSLQGLHEGSLFPSLCISDSQLVTAPFLARKWLYLRAPYHTADLALGFAVCGLRLCTLISDTYMYDIPLCRSLVLQDPWWLGALVSCASPVGEGACATGEGACSVYSAFSYLFPVTPPASTRKSR